MGDRQLDLMIDLMIVGVQKSGTTTLLRYLGAHPRIAAQVLPEMTYFRDTTLKGDLSDHWDRYFGGAPGGSGRTVRLGKLAGLLYEPHAVERLHRHNPSVQAVVVLRDPVHRAHSQFWYSRLKGMEPLTTFEEALRGDPSRFASERDAFRCRYREAGLYAEPIERLFDTFGRDQVHVLVLEEFRTNAAQSVTTLLANVGLDSADLPELAPAHNSSREARSLWLTRTARTRTGPMKMVKAVLPFEAKHRIRRRLLKANEVPRQATTIDPATEAELRAYYQEPNRRLERLLGRDLSDLWCAGRDPGGDG